MTHESRNYERRTLHLAEKLKAAYAGSNMARAEVKEAAISTSDFPQMFTDITTAQLQEKYELDESTTWDKIARKVTLDNFLPQSMIDLGWDDAAMDNLLAANGGIPTVAGTLPVVPEGTEYPTAFKLYSSKEQITTRKNGARVPVTFETFINDQWGVLEELPSELLRTAKLSENAAITKQLVAVDGSGLNTDNFNTNNGTLLKYGANTPGEAALTRETLKAALTQAKSFKAGPNKNRPVIFRKFTLVVPQALEQTAKDILALPREMLITDGNKQYHQVWDYGADFELVVDPFLDQINTTNGETCWFVVPHAGEGKRTSLALAFLRGYEVPELRVHNDQGFLLGGGAVNPRHGSFRNDNWEIRIRHIYDSAALNGMLGSVGSKGTAVPTP